MNTKGGWALIICALIALVTAISHISCIFLGAACYQAQLAPAQIVQSATDGTLLAPLATLTVSLLFILCGLFALSGASFIKKLPFQNLALLTIAILCTLRGLSTVPLSFLFPEIVSDFSLIAGAIWFITGLLYAYGYICVRKSCA